MRVYYHSHLTLACAVCVLFSPFFPPELETQDNQSTDFACWFDLFIADQVEPELLSYESQPRLGPLCY